MNDTPTLSSSDSRKDNPRWFLWPIAIGIIVLIVGGGWYAVKKYKLFKLSRDYPEHRLEQPPHYTIDVQKKDGKMTISNQEEDVELVVGQNWEAQTLFLKTEQPLILQASLIKKVQTEEGGFEGLDISIMKYENPDKLFLDYWMKKSAEYADYQKTTLGNRNTYFLVSKDKRGTEDGMWVVQNSKVQFFFMQATKNLTIYKVSCIAEGKEYQNYADQCLEILKNNLRVP